MMIETLEPLSGFRKAHVPQWRALKLLTGDLDIYKGDLKAEKLGRRSSLEAYKRESCEP